MKRPIGIPSSTYRLQMNADFTFERAEELLDYLDALGVSDLYLSPIFKARPGSRHGYDVVDHSRINPELGGEEGFKSFALHARAYGMGVVLDVVPNHMCIASPENRWWNDVLESGAGSVFESYFDIDWSPVKPHLAVKVLLPVLGETFGEAVEEQKIRLVIGGEGFEAVYYDNRFPLAPETWNAILEPALGRMEGDRGGHDPAADDLRSFIGWLSHIPPRTLKTPGGKRNRNREKALVKERFGQLMAESTIRGAVEETLEVLNGRPGDSRSFEALASLLDQQVYRLSYWPVSGDEINYRRFFDINELAALKAEEPEVFEATHRLVFRLVEEGRVRGLRIDHVDGLRDPLGYLRKLPRDCHVVVEKILEKDERLRSEWPVSGTTGYEFLNALNGVFVDPKAAPALRQLYARFTGRKRRFRSVVYQAKMAVLRTSMWGDLANLARRLDRISEQHHLSRDFTLRQLEQALSEIMAAFPVYRTYIRAANESVSAVDRSYIVSAVQAARRRSPPTMRSVYDFVTSVLLLDEPEGLDQKKRRERRDFVLRFQQLTAPVTAKGVEDTSFYRYYPLASLAEVGGRPDRFGITVEEFHRQNRQRLHDWPGGLTASSTHDTKRDEDVRARINVLSEVPEAWQERVFEWSALNREHKVVLNRSDVPDANEEYLLYQTLLGSWPLTSNDPDGPGYADFVARTRAYMIKATREAKLHTSWRLPDRRYEQAISKFVTAVMDRSRENPFLEDFLRFERSIRGPGLLNALSQTLLKIASPGVADFYQGTEMWDFRLVDPDNRRAVDFSKRRRALASLSEEEEELPALCERLLQDLEDGRLKLFVTSRGLRYRRRYARIFLDGEYVPIEAKGPRKSHVVAFVRRGVDREAMAVVARFFTRLPSPPIGKVWEGNYLHISGGRREGVSRTYRDILTGRVTEVARRQGGWGLPLGSVFDILPLALLEKIS